jgi:2-amino-4-hydroxy-6-hydroxymethyldihydropteridine diphosphokinase
MINMHEVYLSLGSNLGDKRKNIRLAIEKIGEQVGEVVRQSALYETEPWGFESENRFVNAAVKVMTELSPMEVLRATQQIERELGRRKKSQSPNTHHPSPDTPLPVYHDRPIDIDILLYDDWIVDEPELRIPHPLMYKRDFVMIPLREILD